MPASPYKRNRRMKSRLTAGSEDERVNLRTKAVEMMRTADARKVRKDRGPVAHAYVPGRDKATPHRPSKPRAGDVVRGTKVPTGPDGRPISSGHVPVRPAAARPHAADNSSRSFPRPTQPNTGPKSSLGKTRIRLMPESGGTGNHAAPQTAMKNDTLDKGARRPVAKRPASAYNNQLSSLARQRALSENKNNTGTRALMSVATRDTDTGSALNRVRRRVRRRAANNWLYNHAQGPSRKLYT